MSVPSNPKIYHITHYENLISIIKSGALYSDAYCLRNKTGHTIIGMSDIKKRRLEELEVGCHRGTKVGEYVPFYFCPRSIMLYLLHMGNHIDLSYGGGQEPVIHVEADLKAVVSWANKNNVRWAFSDRNAGAYYTEYYNDLRDLEHVNWPAVSATDFRSSTIKDGKQAEFLLYESFPIDLIDRIGVCSNFTKVNVDKIVRGSCLESKVYIKSDWYF